jgi:hypothetical protein
MSSFYCVRKGSSCVELQDTREAGVESAELEWVEVRSRSLYFECSLIDEEGRCLLRAGRSCPLEKLACMFCQPRDIIICSGNEG